MDKDLILRVLLVWGGMMCAEILHGIVRMKFLSPYVGDFRSRQIGVGTGSLLVLVLTYYFLPGLNAKASELMSIGIVWATLTVFFEIALGRAFHLTWSRIFSDFNIFHGGLLPLGLATMAVAPWLMTKLR